MMNNSNQNLLIFDEDSPLFIKQKVKLKKVIDIQPVNKYVLKYSVKGPDDCKHISAAFMKKLNAVWAQLESGDNIKASEVPSYIRGAASVIRQQRPKEFEELKVLITLAKQILSEK